MHDLFGSDSAASTPGPAPLKSEGSSEGLNGGAKVAVTLSVLLCVAVIGAGYHVYQKKKVTEGDVPAVYPDLDNNLALDDTSLRATPVVDVGPEKDFDGNELKNVELL